VLLYADVKQEYTLLYVEDCLVMFGCEQRT